MVRSSHCFVSEVLTVEGTANELQDEESFDHIWVFQEISQYAVCVIFSFVAKIVQNTTAGPEANAAVYQS